MNEDQSWKYKDRSLDEGFIKKSVTKEFSKDNPILGLGITGQIVITLREGIITKVDILPVGEK